MTKLSGFTLIEVLVSIAMLAILAGSGVAMFAITNNSYQRAEAINQMRTQGSQVMEGMERNVRFSTQVSIVQPPPIGTSCTNPPTQLPSPDVCTAEMALSLAPSSLAAQQTNCDKVYYRWYKENTSASPPINGKLTILYYSTSGNPLCTAPYTTETPLFDTDPTQGVSVTTSGTDTSPFGAVAGGSFQKNVYIHFHLLQGAGVKPGGSVNNRASVDLQTFTTVLPLSTNN